ncbi:MAG: integrase core domain-containing protein [Acidobacteriaceae bacterium]
MRDECLNASWFRTLNDVRQTLEQWRQEYNCERPHNSLASSTPREFSIARVYGDVESKQRFPHPHIPTGPTTTAAVRYTHSQNKTENLQL